MLVDKSVWIIPGVMKVSILQFHIILAIGSSSCGIIYALALRHAGGVLDKILQKIDAIGFLLVLYSFFVSSMEGVLLYEESLNGDFKTGEKDRSYSNTLVVVTSFLLAGTAMLLKCSKVITSTSFLLSISLASGKVIASLVTSDHLNDYMLDEHEHMSLINIECKYNEIVQVMNRKS